MYPIFTLSSVIKCILYLSKLNSTVNPISTPSQCVQYLPWSQWYNVSCICSELSDSVWPIFTLSPVIQCVLYLPWSQWYISSVFYLPLAAPHGFSPLPQPSVFLPQASAPSPWLALAMRTVQPPPSVSYKQIVYTFTTVNRISWQWHSTLTLALHNMSPLIDIRFIWGKNKVDVIKCVHHVDLQRFIQDLFMIENWFFKLFDIRCIIY